MYQKESLQQSHAYLHFFILHIYGRLILWYSKEKPQGSEYLWFQKTFLFHLMGIESSLIFTIL